ncbi:elongation factor 1-beta [Caldiplasma sukawensis]
MAEVVITFSVLPEEDYNIDDLIENLKNNLKDKCKVAKIEKKDLAFGLQNVNLQVIVPDRDNEHDRIEGEIKKIKGVGQVETEELGLV